MKKIIIFVAVIFSGNVSAFYDFKCTIKDAVNLESDGSLNHRSHLVEWYIGKEFTVNRSTGVITGARLNNSMSGKMPTVYDYLPEENGYKAVTLYKPNNTIDYLQINQYVESEEKPFFYKGAFGTMVSGTCSKF